MPYKAKKKSSVGKTAMRKVSKYTKLQRAAKRACGGSATAKKSLTKAKKTYIENAVKNGKTKAQATAIANKVMSKSCPTK